MCSDIHNQAHLEAFIYGTLRDLLHYSEKSPVLFFSNWYINFTQILQLIYQQILIGLMLKFFNVACNLEKRLVWIFI